MNLQSNLTLPKSKLAFNGKIQASSKNSFSGSKSIQSYPVSFLANYVETLKVSGPCWAKFGKFLDEEKFMNSNITIEYKKEGLIFPTYLIRVSGERSEVESWIKNVTTALEQYG